MVPGRRAIPDGSSRGLLSDAPAGATELRRETGGPPRPSQRGATHTTCRARTRLRSELGTRILKRALNCAAAHLAKQRAQGRKPEESPATADPGGPRVVPLA